MHYATTVYALMSYDVKRFPTVHKTSTNCILGFTCKRNVISLKANEVIKTHIQLKGNTWNKRLENVNPTICENQASMKLVGIRLQS